MAQGDDLRHFDWLPAFIYYTQTYNSLILTIKLVLWENLVQQQYV